MTEPDAELPPQGGSGRRKDVVQILMKIGDTASAFAVATVGSGTTIPAIVCGVVAAGGYGFAAVIALRRGRP